MGEGREGTANKVSGEVIENTLGISNAGKYLYKTTYDTGAYEIRDSRGQIVSSGSDGAAWAQTPNEKAASVARYQAANIAKMQAEAAKGGLAGRAAEAWLSQYDKSDSVMKQTTYGKVWAGQTDSTTKSITGLVVAGQTRQNGEEAANTKTDAKAQQTAGYEPNIIDSFYNTRNELVDSDNLVHNGAGWAVTFLTPLDLMETTNKLATGRANEISGEDILFSLIDAGGLALGLFTGGTGYLGSRALKTGLKVTLATGASAALMSTAKGA